MQDGARESAGYANRYYAPANDPLSLAEYEEPFNLADPNRWQPLRFENFVDQSGNPIDGGMPDFLSPEWGEVTPFALDPEDLEILEDGFESYVYHNPGPPPLLGEGGGLADPYKWHFALVAAWSSHLDPTDTTRIDISPRSIGNVPLEAFPRDFSDYSEFYNLTEGGDIGTGHPVNPVTGQPYAGQLVKRADYARVLAEFWADGPDSETPPGHWFTILNYVHDHPETSRRIGGQGPVLDHLEWEVKSYLALGGAMHDAAISAWGVKGYYDYIRPISAIRYMASRGQSSNPAGPSYHPHGIPLIPGYIEVIGDGDPLAGSGGEHVGKIKIRAWKGPDSIADPTSDIAGVDWILGTRWWPYQRPSFVTPPFAGYVSGHSTFSRAAAEVLTLFTGDPFFPGGMGEFQVDADSFLAFEQGPSEAFTLQWATYRDASDQTSLSRIWGGIHPPADDIPGRLMGEVIGKDAYRRAEAFFNGQVALGPENFRISVRGESCNGQDNGQISVTALDFHEYEATFSGPSGTGNPGVVHAFNQELSLDNLEPGTYNLCVRIQGKPGTEQCFALSVAGVAPLAVQASAEEQVTGIQVNFRVESGTGPYYLEINDQPAGRFEQKEIRVSARAGDVLKLATSRPCEGTYTHSLPGISRPGLIPNPVQSEAVIQWGEPDTAVRVVLFSAAGQLISEQTVPVIGRLVRFPTAQLASGIYFVKVTGQTSRNLQTSRTLRTSRTLKLVKK